MVTNLFLCNLIIFSCSASLVLSDYSISSYLIFTLLLNLNDCFLHRLLAWKCCLTCSICWQTHYFISIHHLDKGMDHRTLIFDPQGLHSEAIIFLLMLTKLLCSFHLLVPAPVPPAGTIFKAENFLDPCKFSINSFISVLKSCQATGGTFKLRKNLPPPTFCCD